MGNKSNTNFSSTCKVAGFALLAYGNYLLFDYVITELQKRRVANMQKKYAAGLHAQIIKQDPNYSYVNNLVKSTENRNKLTANEVNNYLKAAKEKGTLGQWRGAYIFLKDSGLERLIDPDLIPPEG